MTQLENNFVLVISREHKLILETLGELDSVLHLTPQAEMLTKLRNILEQCREQLRTHQEFEEEVIFKSALEALPTEKVISIIMRLQKEHGTFLASMDAAIFNIFNMPECDKLTPAIEANLNRISTSIKKHSITEVKELFPVITSHARCRQLIDQQILKLQRNNGGAL